MDNKKFTYIAEFAGCGGTSVGARMVKANGVKGAGIGECRLLIEWDPYDAKQNAYELLKRNFPEVHAKGRIINHDITTFNGRHQLRLANLKKGNLDLLTSSAPCQGWSSSNMKKSKDDYRNDLFLNTIRNIKMTQPKCVLLENVKGICTSKKLKFKYYQIISELKAAGYRVKTWVIDSKDYGIPQSRERAFIIGVREDLCDQYGVEPSIPDVHSKFVGLGDVLPNLSGHVAAQFEKTVHPKNEPVGCITKTVGFKVIEDGELRYPTIPELVKLSTFPEDYDWGDSSFTQVHNRVGNSVLPKVAEILIEHLYDTVIAKIDPLHRKAELALIDARDKAI